MSASSITIALQGPPDIHYGWWHSDGDIVPRGNAITLSLRHYSWLNTLLTLLAGFALSKLWRVLTGLIFASIIDRTKTSLDESQAAVLLVNSKTPMDYIFSFLGINNKRGALKSFIKTLLTSIIILGTTWTALFLIPRFPSYNLGRIKSSGCGLLPRGTDINDDDAMAKYVQLANEAKIISEQGLLGATQAGRKESQIEIPFPNATTTYVPQCPPNMQCHPDYPFTFSTNYTLKPEHFRTNLDLHHKLSVSEVCYRPTDAISQISPVPANSSTRYTPLSYLYGPAEGEENNSTYHVFPERRLSPGYSLWHVSSMADAGGAWSPNSSLTLGGDATIFFYEVGGVTMNEESNDPIFATNSFEQLPTSGHPSRYVSVPIVCDTKYDICLDDRKICSGPVGVVKLNDWLKNQGGPKYQDLAKVLFYTLLTPPMHSASLGSNPVLASETLSVSGYSQTKPRRATTLSELNSLSTTGLGIIAASMQLAVNGYWSLGEGVDNSDPEWHLSAICGSVLVESAEAITVPILDYVIVLVICIVFVLIGFITLLIPLLGKRWGSWWTFAHQWSFHTAGQLHRRVAKQQHGDVGENNPNKDYPRFANGLPGLNLSDEPTSKNISTEKVNEV